MRDDAAGSKFVSQFRNPVSPYLAKTAVAYPCGAELAQVHHDEREPRRA